MVQAPPKRSKKEKSTKQKAQDQVTALFEKNGWSPFPFQKKTWSAYAKGQSGLIHAPTGTGKTYAAWAGPLIEWMDEHAGKPMPKRAPELRVLWLTPLRALVKDTTHSLCSMIEQLGLPWTVEERTGDTTGAMKAKQRKRFPSCLVTTPEKVCLFSCLTPKPSRPFPTSGQWWWMSGTNCYLPNGVCRPNWDWPVCANGIPNCGHGDYPPLWVIWMLPNLPFGN